MSHSVEKSPTKSHLNFQITLIGLLLVLFQIAEIKIIKVANTVLRLNFGAKIQIVKKQLTKSKQTSDFSNLEESILTKE